MFFNSVKEINRLRNEINMLLICAVKKNYMLLSNGMWIFLMDVLYSN